MQKPSTVVTVATLITVISTLITFGYSARAPIASLPASSAGSQLSTIPVIDLGPVEWKLVDQMRRLALFIAAAFLSGLALAQGKPAHVDWKVYGGASFGERALCFYDAKGVAQMASDHVRVWTKCLRQMDLDGVDIKKDFGGKILEKAAAKTRSAYVPPSRRWRP
ncbi:hypothetical protein ACV22V_31705 [Burkholderia sp. AW33-5]